MPDAREMTQRIVGWLSTGRVPDTAEAASVAEGYALLTRRASERLSRCAGLLAQGLRTEAVQEADAEPELLRELATLELPGEGGALAWGEVCRKQGWPVPELIRPDVVAQMNRAYADESLVEPLLREYRLRCVVRAPIGARLAALRALAGVDRANRPWHDQLVALEKARHAELREEVRDAMGDVDTLQGLRRELKDDRQKVRPPADLVRAVEEALQDGRVARAQRRLEALLPSLETAYSAMDFPACSSLLGDWAQTLKAVGRSALQVPEALRERVEPVMQWVERQSEAQAAELRFRGACDRLREEVAGAGTPAALRERMVEAGSYERALPGTLAMDAEEALARRMAGERRRRHVRVGLAACGVLVLVWLLGMWAWDARQQERFETRLASLAAEVEAGALSSAEAGWEALVARYPERARGEAAGAVRSGLDEALAEASDRAARFAALSGRLDAAAVGSWDEAMVAELEALASSEEEMLVSAGLLGRWEAHVEAEAARADAAALAAVGEMRAALNNAGGEALATDAAGVKAEVVSVSRRAAGLRSDVRLPAATVALLEAVEARAARLVSAADESLAASARAAAMAEAEAALVGRLDDPAALSAALVAFAEAYPSSSSAGAYRRASGGVDGWRAVEDWLALVAGWDSLEPADRVEAAARLGAIAAYRSAHRESPWSEAVSAYAGYWGSGLLVSAEDGPWLGRLPALMAAPAFRDLGMAETADGRRFYVVGDAGRRETSLGSSLNVALSPDLTRLTPMQFEAGALGPIGPSPQSDLANGLLAAVADFSFGAWDLFVVDVVEWVYAADEVDAVLRGVLLGLLLDAYAESVSDLDPALVGLRKRLLLQADSSANWMDPADAAAARSRVALSAMFAEGIDTAAMRARAAARRAAVGEGIEVEVLGRGLMGLDGSGERTLRKSRDWSGDAGVVFGVMPEDGAWRRLGVWDGTGGGEGRVRWERASAFLPAGSMVWLVAAEDGVGALESGAGR